MNALQVVNWREPTWQCISNKKFPTDHSCDNALLFTATYIMQADDPESERYTFKCFSNACQVQPGLFNRYPGYVSAEGWDDLIGVVAASVKLGLNYHHEILRWGELNNWTWNNVNPNVETLDSFLGRYPCFIPFLQMACGHTPSPADELLFISGNEASAMTSIGNESGKCLQYLMNKTVYGRRKEVDASIWLWGKLMARNYPNGMRDVYSRYFGPAHPFSLYGPTNFD